MKFILSPELAIPFIASNAVAIWIVWLTFRRRNVAEGALAILFLGAGCFNIYTAVTNPDSYLQFAETSFVAAYREFIRGTFAAHATIIVSAIGVIQLYIGIAMLMENIRYRVGCIGGFIFGIAIAPLGMGSAFPSTLVLSFAFLVLFLKTEAQLRSTDKSHTIA